MTSCDAVDQVGAVRRQRSGELLGRGEQLQRGAVPRGRPWSSSGGGWSVGKEGADLCLNQIDAEPEGLHR